MQRQFLLIAFNLILLGAVLFFAPQQIPVTLYKLSLITLAALVGFWIDRWIFPYARPDQIIQPKFSIGGPFVGNREVAFSVSMIRRALIICFAMLTMGWGHSMQRKPDDFFYHLCLIAYHLLNKSFFVVWVPTILVLVVFAFSSNIQAAEDIPRNAHHFRAELTRTAHAVWGLDAPIPVFAAQIHQESAWKPDAVSKVGAQGMAQFMPATAKWLCELNGTHKSMCLPHNPVWAMRALVQYDQWLYARVWGLNDYDRTWAMLRAYNGGLGWWQREALLTPNRRLATREEIDAMCGKHKRAQLHCRENLNYPKRILNVYQPRYFGWGAKIVIGGSV